jgi:hypothetical protein
VWLLPSNSLSGMCGYLCPHAVTSVQAALIFHLEHCDETTSDWSLMCFFCSLFFILDGVIVSNAHLAPPDLLLLIKIL